MTTDVISESDKLAKHTAELLAFIKTELEADAERHAKLQASGAGELPHESQTGVTLDLGHKNLRVLPLEVISLIKDKVERYDFRRGASGAVDADSRRRLALSHNPCISVPPQIAQCERLRYLNIRWNQLVDFPGAVRVTTSIEVEEPRMTNIFGGTGAPTQPAGDPRRQQESYHCHPGRYQEVDLSEILGGLAQPHHPPALCLGRDEQVGQAQV